MTAHDPLCKHRVLVTGFSTFEIETCDCERVARIRADERERLQDKVLALPDPWGNHGSTFTLRRRDVLALLGGESDG